MDQAIAAVETVALRYAEEIEIQGKLLAEAIAADNGQDLKIKSKIGQLHGRIKRLRKDSGRSNCLKFAHTNPVNPLAVRAADFDLNPWLLACANGVINLKTGELEPGRPADFISKRARAEFPAEGVRADTSALHRILLAIHSGDEELVQYKQRLFGYGITGLATEHVFPVLHGRGRNGKSIEVEALCHVLGDYAGPVPAEMLLESNRSAAAGASSPEIMALKGLRLAICSETDEGRKFSSAKVKWLTGGDTLTGRGLYDKHLISFTPTHLLVLLTNSKPTAPATDFAFWERCKLIHYLLSFVVRSQDELATKPLKPHERLADQTIPDQLKALASIHLAWLVKGCLDWQRLGMSPPRAISEATTNYQEDENYIGQFLDAVCVQAAGLHSSAADLYDAFRHWYRLNVNANAKYLPSQKSFGQKLLATDLFERKRTSGYYHYHGLAVSEAYQLALKDHNGDDSWQKG
jgi:putative DNA primase/helicase